MNFHILTLFPEMVESGLSESIIGRARENGSISVETVNIRDFSEDKHKKVDDYLYGGGAGLLMQAQPVYDAHRSVLEKTGDKCVRTIYLTPQGRTFCQEMAEELAQEEDLIFLCGHYEGIDERVLEEIVTDYVSLGDFVLTGGELPAMVMIDAISRLVPGVLHNDISTAEESFSGYLLEYPQYSRPELWHDKPVPEALLSGDHKKIRQWRLEASIERTRKRRPDLYARYEHIMQCRDRLLKDKLQHIDMLELIHRGRAKMLFTGEEGTLLKDKDNGNYMLTAISKEAGEIILDTVFGVSDRGPEKVSAGIRFITHQEFLNEVVCNRFGFSHVKGYYPYTYTRHEAISKRKTDDPRELEEIDFINQVLKQGGIPFLYVSQEDSAAIKRQEKLGLYRAKEKIWQLM
ncbi:MAG: tRNA (guanosine(37)-N1)-methyltransferase TrmD [Lachnospiraceae bacterium]|nr:tRNA (guanosine(37)-N1)-methyltransferase TrmD [Lachnospiraceae bacterium]